MDRTGQDEIEESLTVGGITVQTEKPPDWLALRRELGLLTSLAVEGKVVHVARSPQSMVMETRATVTPNGDFLLMFPEGRHYNGATSKVNEMVAYRSQDSGRTWQGPVYPFRIDFNQHGFIPLIPKGTKRIYCFGTQPLLNRAETEEGRQENAPIGFRYSDDDGWTWSDTRLIRPTNDPDFTGMSVTRMYETERGTWLLGAHEADWSCKPLVTRQYILRSEDRGMTWELLPGPRPCGWQAPGWARMDEGRPIALGGDRVLLLIRTPEGRLWEARSEDDGRTWSVPKPTSLVHPDAPPMVFLLSDQKTLVVFHHNRHSDTNYSGLSMDKADTMKDRSELWVSLSDDGGLTWSDPRFLLANALKPNLENPFRNYQCSYLDAFNDGERLHLFLPHRWQRALHLTVAESELQRLPTRHQLQASGDSR